MTDFTLSRKKENALPSSVEQDGMVFEIDSDFRTMLKIFRMLDDPEILEGHKPTLLCKWLFPHGAPPRWEEPFRWFASAGAEPGRNSGKRELDYEFDAPEIYASFLCLYGIDLYEAELHWWQFRSLLSGCVMCRSPLSEKLRLRNLDVSKCENKAAAQLAKDSVQIPCRVGVSERLLTEQIQQRLINGESVADLIER